jgi:acetolactate synthase-1/2/3 large subunit
VDITKNAQFDLLDFSIKCEGIRSYVAVPKLKLERITDAAELIKAKTYDCLWSRIILGQPKPC